MKEGEKESNESGIIAWIKDIGEVIATLLAIIILSRLFLGPQMLIPLVAVTSSSMLHTDDRWSDWLKAENISENTIDTFPLKGGFATGDMILTVTPNKEGTIHGLFSETQLGDVIIYKRDKVYRPDAPPIIHRVVGIVRIKNGEIDSVEGTLECMDLEDFETTYLQNIKNCNNGGKCPYIEYPNSPDFNFYVTKGDNNPRSDQCINIAYPVTDSQLTARGWIVIPYVGWLKIILNAIIPI